MKFIVGVMGPGATATAEQLKIAYQIGKAVAERGHTLLSGGMKGTMAEACRGAKDAGGLVVGICPTDNADDMCADVDIPIVTGIRGARNFINILSSKIVIAIGPWSSGTLSEIAFAIQQRRPLLIIGGTPEMAAYIKQVEPTGREVVFTRSIDGVKAFLA
ncbi:MAG: TIGR00725 family protein [Patescibacteria group bacterium]